MKKNIYIYIALASFGFVACEPEFNQPLEDTPIAVQSSGIADFSTYISIGNSLTAGFADGALYRDGQENSFANLLANQMKSAGGGEFNIPFMPDNIGGFKGFEDIDFGTRFVLDVDTQGNQTPSPLSETANNDIATRAEGTSFNNMGVPGAKSYQLLLPGLGNPNNVVRCPLRANPYFARFAQTPLSTIIGDATAQAPTFFTLWTGNNDVLSYATSGGAPEEQCDGSILEATNQVGTFSLDLSTATPQDVAQAYRTVANTYGSNDISDPALATTTIALIANTLTANGTNNTRGVVANIPEITSIPFFTTVPNNALVLTAEQAAGLTGFFGLYANITGNPNFAFQFNEGPNRFIIRTVPTSETNPIGDFRQMTENELLLLTIDQNALRTEGYGSARITPEIAGILQTIGAGGTFDPADVPKILTAVNAINDEDVLDTTELEELSAAITAFNTGIASVVDANPNIVLYDANSRLKELSGGITSEGITVTSEFGSGGAFSLDGVHLTPRGNAVIANDLIEIINSNFDATLQPVPVGSFNTITIRSN